MGISERFTTERDKKASEEVEGTLHDYRGAPRGRFYRLSTGRAAHYENIKPTIHRQKTGVYLQTWKKGIIQ